MCSCTFMHVYLQDIYIYIYVSQVYVYMLFKGSASAADLFFCILVSIIHGIWDGAWSFRDIWRSGGGLHIANWCQDMYSSRFWLLSFNFHWFQMDLKAWEGGGCLDIANWCQDLDFHWFSFVFYISGGLEAIRARKLATLWQPVGPCGRFVLLLLECCNQ